jgi:hypothetical protein
MSIRNFIAFSVLTLFPICEVMGDEAKKTLSEAEMFLGRVAGVYKKKFGNSLVDGSKYESEDILEVVPIEQKAAYVRMKLNFFNGHTGGIYGVAQYGKDSLILDVGTTPNSRCVVELVWSQDEVISNADYDKTPGCSMFHGARGSMNGSFATSKRRNIKYLKRLKNSRQYKEALSNWKHPTNSK